MEKNVHTEHCCLKHGCKYGDRDCPVATGKQEQSSHCETCGLVAEGYYPEEPFTQSQVEALVTWHNEFGEKMNRMITDEGNREDYTAAEHELFEAFYEFNDEIMKNNEARHEKHDEFLRKKGLIK